MHLFLLISTEAGLHHPEYQIFGSSSTIYAINCAVHVEIEIENIIDDLKNQGLIQCIDFI